MVLSGAMYQCSRGWIWFVPRLELQRWAINKPVILLHHDFPHRLSVSFSLTTNLSALNFSKPQSCFERDREHHNKKKGACIGKCELNDPAKSWGDPTIESGKLFSFAHDIHGSSKCDHIHCFLNLDLRSSVQKLTPEYSCIHVMVFRTNAGQYLQTHAP